MQIIRLNNCISILFQNLLNLNFTYKTPKYLLVIKIYDIFASTKNLELKMPLTLEQHKYHTVKNKKK